MIQAKTFLGGVIAMLLIGTIAATAALAVEGPFWKVGGSRLISGETRAIIGTAATNQVLTAGSVKVTCTKVALGGSHELQGSTSDNRGFSDEILEFKGCSVAGDGEGCKLKGEEFKTDELLGELVWPGGKREGKLLFHFEATSGKDFAPLHLENCKSKATELVEGKTTFDGVICEAWSGKKVIEEGHEPGATRTIEVNCPEKNLTVSDLEVNGNLTEKPGEIDFEEAVATLSGRIALEVGGKEWCVSTGAAGSKC
jgi:hypothetical protein